MKEAFESNEMVKAGPYSHAVAVGDLVFSSGVGPHAPGTGEIPADIHAQVEATMDNLERALALAGASLSGIVRLTVYLQDLHRDKDAMNEVLSRRLPKPYGARTTVGGGLMNILVEIDAVAVRSDDEG